MNSVITFNYSKNLLLKNFIAASRALIVETFKNRSSFCSFRLLDFLFLVKCSVVEKNEIKNHLTKILQKQKDQPESPIQKSSLK